MSPLRFAVFLAYSIPGLLTLSEHAIAQQFLPDYQTNSSPLQVLLKHGETVGNNQVQRAFLTCGTNKYVFIVPSGFRADASSPNKILMTDADNNCFITLRFGESTAAPDQPLGTTACRAEVLNRYPTAKISHEFTALVANHSGPAFDLNWNNPSGVEQSAQVIFIPFSAGLMEFDLLTSSNKFNDGRNILTVLLGSIQNNEEGTIEIIPLPDHS
jgi:hypothetical protein